MEEKYSEYKTERELKRQLQQQQQHQEEEVQQQQSKLMESASLDLPCEDMSDLMCMPKTCSSEEINSMTAPLSMTHSLSAHDNAAVSSSLPNMKSSDSWQHLVPCNDDPDEASKTPTAPPPNVGDGPAAPTSRRRFNFSFLDRSQRNTPAAQTNLLKATTSIKEEEGLDTFEHIEAPPQETTPSQDHQVFASSAGPNTPTRTGLRARMMGLMGKSPAATGNVMTKEQHGLSLKGLAHDDPFSGGSLTASGAPSPETEENSMVQGGQDEDDIEEAIEADEMLVYDPDTSDPSGGEGFYSDEGDDSPDAENVQEHGQIFWQAGLLPILVVLLIQLLPLPTWAVGFVTGLVIGIPATIYGMYVGFVKDSDRKVKFIENVRKRVPKTPAIIVQEELEREYVRTYASIVFIYFI